MRASWPSDVMLASPDPEKPASGWDGEGVRGAWLYFNPRSLITYWCKTSTLISIPWRYIYTGYTQSCLHAGYIHKQGVYTQICILERCTHLLSPESCHSKSCNGPGGNNFRHTILIWRLSICFLFVFVFQHSIYIMNIRLTRTHTHTHTQTCARMNATPSCIHMHIQNKYCFDHIQSGTSGLLIFVFYEPELLEAAIRSSVSNLAS